MRQIVPSGAVATPAFLGPGAADLAQEAPHIAPSSVQKTSLPPREDRHVIRSDPAQHRTDHGRPAGAAIHRRLRPSGRENAESRRACRPRHAVRRRLLQLAAVRAVARQPDDRPACQPPRRLRQCGGFRILGADIRASPAQRRLPDLPCRTHAFRRPGPASRLRGAGHDRRLSGRFRLGAGLEQCRRADRPLVSQHGSGVRGRKRRDGLPDRI